MAQPKDMGKGDMKGGITSTLISLTVVEIGNWKCKEFKIVL